MTIEVVRFQKMLFLEIVLLFIFLQGSPSHSFECIKLKQKVMETKLTTPNAWIQAALIAHNKYRALHGAGPLRLNATLCRSAQWTANKVLVVGFKHTSQMSEGYNVTCGENLYTSAGKEGIHDGYEPVDSWYDEELDYDYTTGTTKVLNRMVGHFTQLVWKNSKEMCIAYAKEGKKFYAAAHYYPRGNARKRYLDQVGKKQGGGKVKPVLNPWMEVVCNKIPLNSYSRQYRCHFKSLIMPPYAPNLKGVSLGKDDRKELLKRLLKLDTLSAHVEAPMRLLGLKL